MLPAAVGELTRAMLCFSFFFCMFLVLVFVFLFFFSVLFCFGEGCKGSRQIRRDREMNEIGVHDMKSTENQF